jgi:methyl-accepting chemotaxis protein
MKSREQNFSDRIPRPGLMPRLIGVALAAAFITTMITWFFASRFHSAWVLPAQFGLAAEFAANTIFSILLFAALMLLFSWSLVHQALIRLRPAIEKEGHRKDALGVNGTEASSVEEMIRSAGPNQTSRDRKTGELPTLPINFNLFRLGLSSFDGIRSSSSRTAQLAGQADLLIQNHVRLDEAINDQLHVVASDTESAALNLILQVRKLNDAAVALLHYLDNSGQSAQSMEHSLEGSVAAIAEISTFIEDLPAMIREDVSTVQATAIKEVDALGHFVAVIKEISMQSTLLAINAAIESAHAGKSGKGFSVLAKELQILAQRSAQAAIMIEKGLLNARNTMQAGLIMSPMESHIAKASTMVDSIRKLQKNYDEIQQYYKTLFSAVTQHNTNLAAEIAELLGHIQFQDVVRQRIERIAIAVSLRNDVLKALPRRLSDAAPDLRELEAQMLGVLDDYLTNEVRHAPSAIEESVDSPALPKFELF